MATPGQRSLNASIAAHTRWSRVADRTAATEPGRRGLEARFEREVDPDGVLSPEERAKRARNAKAAHFRRMNRASAAARARRTA